MDSPSGVSLQAARIEVAAKPVRGIVLEFATRKRYGRGSGCAWQIFGGPGRDRTDDLFHAIPAIYLFSITYKRVRELPSTSKYLQQHNEVRNSWVESWVKGRLPNGRERIPNSGLEIDCWSKVGIYLPPTNRSEQQHFLVMRKISGPADKRKALCLFRTIFPGSPEGSRRAVE